MGAVGAWALVMGGRRVSSYLSDKIKNKEKVTEEEFKGMYFIWPTSNVSFGSFSAAGCKILSVSYVPWIGVGKD
jgi:hypothetical protein